MIHAAVRVPVSGLLLTWLVLAGLSTPVGAVNDRSASALPRSATGLAIDAEDGSLLKADGGLFRSTDQGQSWTGLPLPDDLNPDQIREVTTTAAAPSSLYAAGPRAGILHSDDRGESWRTVSDGLPSQEVGAFAVHSYLPDTLYAWIEGEGVFRTEDGGERWELMDEGPPGPVAALAHSTYKGSMNTGWLYAATPDGPYLSMDCF